MRRKAGMWASVTGTMVAEGCGQGVEGGRAVTVTVTGEAGITGAAGCCGGGGGAGGGACCTGGCCDIGGAAYFGGCCLLLGWKKERIEGCCARDMAG